MAVAQSAMIEALNEQLREAFETRDFRALADMFTDDAVILPPRRNIITGKSKIQSFWARSNRIRELKFETDSITTLSGDVIREIGSLRMPVGPGGGERGGQGGSGAKSEPAARPPLQEILGKYVFVWRKINDQWKLETSIWNRNRASTASRRRGSRRNRE